MTIDNVQDVFFRTWCISLFSTYVSHFGAVATWLEQGRNFLLSQLNFGLSEIFRAVVMFFSKNAQFGAANLNFAVNI